MPAMPIPDVTDLRALPVGRCEDGVAVHDPAARNPPADRGRDRRGQGIVSVGPGPGACCPRWPPGWSASGRAIPKLMELAFGRALFDTYGRYAADPAEIADLLEEAVAEMQARAARFAGQAARPHPDRRVPVRGGPGR